MVERLGVVDEVRERENEIYRAQRGRMSPAALARAFPHRHPTPVAPMKITSTLVRAEEAKGKPPAPTVKAIEIAADALSAVDKVLAERRKEKALEAMGSAIDRPTPDQIIEIIAILADIQPDAMKGYRRSRRIAWPRQVAMALVKQAVPKMSLPQIGRAFGGKDHTTVMHALKRTDKYIEDGCAMAQLYGKARVIIESKWPEAFK